MALSNQGLYERSPPARVIFAGMEGYTPSMEANGWEFYLETTRDTDFIRGRFSMTMRHRPSGLVLFAQGLTEDFHAAAFNLGRGGEPEFHVSRVIHEKHSEIVMADALEPKFNRVSMSPFLDDATKLRRFKLADLFTRWAPDAQEIIVEPKTVASLMAEIVSLQQPELAEIRRRAYVRDSRPQQDQMVAQIIAFAA